MTFPDLRHIGYYRYYPYPQKINVSTITSTVTIDELKEIAYRAEVFPTNHNCFISSEELQKLIDNLLDPLSLCLLDGLCLFHVDITPQILQLLLDLLNARFLQPSSTSPVFPLQNKYYKTVGFSIYLHSCKISECTTGQDQSDLGEEGGRGNEYQNICSALLKVYRSANVLKFSVVDSPTVTACLMTARAMSSPYADWRRFGDSYHSCPHKMNSSTITIDELKEAAYRAEVNQSKLTCSTVSEELQTLIDRLSNPWSLCLLKELCLSNVDIKPRILRLLLKLLNARFLQPSSTSPVFALQNKYYKTVGIKIELSGCKISVCTTGQDHDDQGEGENGNGNEYEKEYQNICSALLKVYRSADFSEFYVINSPTIANCLITAQEISDTDSLSIQSERTLRGICHQAVTSLLQDPSNQLRHLHLNRCDLVDDHLIAILDLLPTSWLKTLNISSNIIQSRGVMEFARRLPNIKFLTSVSLQDNPWEKSTNLEECYEALVEGMMHNTSIEYFFLSRQLLPSQSRLIKYYCDLNHARRAMTSPDVDSEHIGYYHSQKINLPTITINELKQLAQPAVIDQSKLTCSTVSEELQRLIDKLSNPLSLCLLDGLCLRNVDITPQILQLLVKLLNARFSQPLSSLVFSLQHQYYNTVGFNIELFACKISQSSTDQDPGEGEGRNGNEYEKEYQNENVSSVLEEVYGSPNVLNFSVDDSPTVADCLMAGVRGISGIHTSTASSSCDTGFVVQVRTNMKDLQIKIRVRAPEELRILLTAACSLTSFSLHKVKFSESNPTQHGRTLRAICHQAVARFLQDPNSQLQHLHLNHCALDDDHLIAILDLLPISRLKTLDVSHNNIQSRGVMEFARRLPNIKILTKVCLGYNPWENSTNREECREALVEGMMHNKSIEYFDFSIFYPPLIEYYCKLNFIRRNILLASTPVPLGLWPQILERGKARVHCGADMIYFMLQNSPITTLYGDRGSDGIPQDEVPQDEIPQDEIPQDEIPQDEIPHDGIRQHFTKYFSCLIQPFSPGTGNFMNLH